MYPRRSRSAVPQLTRRFSRPVPTPLKRSTIVRADKIAYGIMLASAKISPRLFRRRSTIPLAVSSTCFRILRCLRSAARSNDSSTGEDGMTEVCFGGDFVDPEAIGNLLSRAARSAHPVGFEYACSSTKLRPGAFGGGCVVVSDDQVRIFSTSERMSGGFARSRLSGVIVRSFALSLNPFRRSAGPFRKWL